MKLLIFDVYQTLLLVESFPPSQDRFDRLLTEFSLPQNSPPSLSDLQATLEELIRRDHAAAKAAGIGQPEVNWPRLLLEALPAAGGMSQEQLIRFSAGVMACQRRVSLMPGAEQTLHLARQLGLTLGILSNAQAYTPIELDEALQPWNLSLDLFHPDFVFWSFEHGFAKPDPYCFRILTSRAEAIGHLPSSIWLVGDRLDNDIQPSLRQGWQAWHLSRQPQCATGGDHAALQNFLQKTLC